MKAYKSTPTSQLRAGMTVHIHGSEFRITSNPVPCVNPLLQGVYLVGCEIIDALPAGDYMELLNDYKVIQGNDLALWGVVIEE